MDNYTPIFNCWNSQLPRGRLIRHKKIDSRIRRAIDENLQEGWDAEDMCEAITNFCAAVANRETIWGDNGKYSQAVQRWGLFEFLHRGCVDVEKGKRFAKFTDNNWQEQDWLTQQAVQERIKQRRLVAAGTEILKESQPARISYEKMLDEELAIAYNQASRFEKSVIERVRPEIKQLKEVK